MMPRNSVCLAILLVVGVSGAGAQEAPAGCEPMGDARPVCKFHGPEDLAALPGARHCSSVNTHDSSPKRSSGSRSTCRPRTT